MANIAIICSIERLFGAYGQISNAAYFGMNLSAAIVGTAADVTAENKALAIPWTWNLTGLKAWVGTSADPNQGQEVAVTLAPRAQIQRSDLITSTLLNQAPQAPEGFLFSEAPESSPSFEGASWHALLAHASTYAAPVPHSLNLAMHFSVANLPAAGNLYVAPILDAGGAGNPITLKQSPAIPAAGKPAIAVLQATAPGTIGFAKWTYTDPPAGQIPIAGYVNQIDLAAPPAKGAFIDFSNLWIKGVEQTEDWRAQLESRIAEAFDLSRAILDFAQQNNLAPAAIASNFFASLRDRANAGLFFAPDSSSLARYLMAQCQEAIGDSSSMDPMIQALAQYEQAVTLGAWQRLLQQTIPEGPAITAAMTSPALETWYGLLADDDVLARLIYAQWSNAVKAAPAPAADFWNKIAGPLQNQVLPAVQIRKRYALATIGNLAIAPPADPFAHPDLAHELWKPIVTGANGIQANMADFLVRYANGRFGGGDASDKTRYQFFFPQNIAPLPADPTKFLTDRANQFYTNVIQPPAAASAPTPGQAAPMSTPVPAGITLQLDSLTAVADSDDFQRKMTGAGVLMRKKGGTWRCLNFAALYSRTVDASGAATDTAIFAGGSVVPYRLDYHNGVRQAFISYKNHPLVAESPAAALAGNLQLTDDSPAPSRSLLTYKMDFTGDPSNPQVFNPWAILPGLFYSDADQAYEFLPFAMTNSGAIPAELAVPEQKDANGNVIPAIPSQIRPIQAFSSATLTPIEAGYKRRVQVGALRLRDQKGQVLTETSQLLPLPANVTPKFHDIAPSGVTQPLLFLYPPPSNGPAGTDSFSFSIRPPATDINTWDQSVGPGNADQRVTAWADYHTNSPQAPVANPIALDTNRVTFDDPAVTGIQCTLTQIWPGKTVISQPTVVSFDKSASLYQAPAIPVNCSIGAAAIQLPATPGGAIAVLVPANEVWQLSVVPVIAGTSKFESGVLGVASDGPLPSSAFQMVIEVASPALPAAVDIWKSLVLLTTNAGAPSFTVAMLPDLSDPASPWANVRTVELLRQTWRWSGRPFPAFGNFPQNQLDPLPGGAETPAMIWEAEAFGERDDSDHVSTPKQINFAGLAAGGAAIPLYTEDLSNDVRTHYYRFALRVTSRYSGILSAPQQTSQAPLVTPAGNGFTIWRRYWIGNRCANPLPKPQIKIILPLTAPEDASDTVPGLLCILNEPWYTIGGLSEQLQAQIALSDVPGPTPGAPLPLEFGPDPILTGDPGTFVPNGQLQIGGPFGYTFDTGTTAPLIVGSSFVIRPPAGSVNNLAWYFAKLQFARVVGNLTSPPTDAQWVQFAPDFASYQTSNGVAAVKDLSVQRLSDTSFQLSRAGSAVEFQPSNTFEIAAIVTQNVTDAFGRQGQERFVGIGKYDATQKVFNVTTKLPATFVVRLIEIQRQGKAGADLFGDLFPEPQTGADANARIVRISPRLN